MDEYHYQRLLKDPRTFGKSENLLYLEIWNYEDPSKNYSREGILPESDMTSWLEQTGPYQSPAKDGGSPKEGLRLLILGGHDPYDDSELPLPIARKTFEEIVGGLLLPKSFLPTLERGTTAFYRVPQNSDCFVVQNNGQSSGHFSLALTYHIKTHVTCGLLGGLRLGADVSFILASHELVGLPMFLPALFVELKSHSTNSHVHSCKLKLQSVEQTTEIRRDDVLSNLGKTRTDIANLDLDGITRELTSVSSKLAHCNYSCQLHLPMLDFFDEINQWAVKKVSNERREDLAKAEQVVLARTAYLRNWLKVISIRTKYLSQRAQAQVQTIYSLIAQKDNALNIQTAATSLQNAEATLKISEASQRDSAAMKAIAEDSKMVALATSVDSGAMRTIGVVTMIFLPATFTATLFSTSFFNFQVPRHGRVVSWWFWLYWVVTISLTCMVLTSWFILAPKKMPKAMETSRNCVVAQKLNETASDDKFTS